MLDVFRLIRFYNRVKKDFVTPDPFLHHGLAGLDETGVDRRALLLDVCRGKKVLHFGFLDSPLLEARVRDHALLHQELRQSAASLFGVDVDAGSLQRYRELTGDCDNIAADVESCLTFPDLVRDFDVILLPEVLEHVKNPGNVLSCLKELCRLNGDAALCITVPNAFSIQGIVAAMNRFEYVHPDHYFYFSPVTLRKLLIDCGFGRVEIGLYGYGYMVDAPALTKNGVFAICRP